MRMRASRICWLSARGALWQPRGYTREQMLHLIERARKAGNSGAEERAEITDVLQEIERLKSEVAALNDIRRKLEKNE